MQSQDDKPFPGAFLSAREAADLLGVRLETIYAYVSRGLLRSEKEEGEVRAHRYRSADVLALRRRGEAKRQPSKALEAALGGALDWGGPLLESAITSIQAGHFYYRGQDAVSLARTSSFEEVVALVWGLAPDEAEALFAAATWPPEMEGWRHKLSELPPLEAAQALLPILASHDPVAFDVRPAATLKAGARILAFLAWIAAGGGVRAAPGAWGGGGVVAALAGAWGVERDKERLLAAALILCVDHELNVSAFTARCIASADAPLYGAVAGGLAALLGSRHGGHTRRVEALLAEIGKPARARKVITERLRRGETIPGFGQRLYPQGDPRAKELFRLAQEHCAGSPELKLLEALCRAAHELLGEWPTVDCGLALVGRLLDLPSDAALTLFGLGRAGGWIGHAREQYALQQLIRPRARYVGEPPQEA